nr:MAG TPA: hypothetical protein [Bacteriophage sp.]
MFTSFLRMRGYASKECNPTPFRGALLSGVPRYLL